MKENSFAYELLSDQRKQNKRLFIIILVILTMWFATGIYLVYILNDIGTEIVTEEVEKYEIEQDSGDNGNNNFINGNSNEVNN